MVVSAAGGGETRDNEATEQEELVAKRIYSFSEYFFSVNFILQRSNTEQPVAPTVPAGCQEHEAVPYQDYQSFQ